VYNNEEELELVGYDNWKLSNGDENMDKRSDYTSTNQRAIIGRCPCCNEFVYDNQIYVLKETTYHYSCHNEKIRDESSNGERI
jgi:hypothetical protein